DDVADGEHGARLARAEDGPARPERIVAGAAGPAGNDRPVAPGADRVRVDAAAARAGAAGAGRPAERVARARTVPGHGGARADPRRPPAIADDRFEGVLVGVEVREDAGGAGVDRRPLRHLRLAVSAVLDLQLALDDRRVGAAGGARLARQRRGAAGV